MGQQFVFIVIILGFNSLIFLNIKKVKIVTITQKVIAQNVMQQIREN